MQEIEVPKIRNNFRRKAGRFYYVFLRKLDWYFGKTKWSRKSDDTFIGFTVFKHSSVILRQLKDVEMYLQENKRTNLKIAISHLNNIVILPGETFSVWKNVGKPTKKKGYLTGLILNQGRIDTGIGGGLCQLGNLLFWIFAHSPLTIAERHRHGFDVFPDTNRSVPFGAGATLSYNYIDFQVRNDTENTFQIKLWLDETMLNGELLSKEAVKCTYRVEERNHLIKQQNWGGHSRHNQIYRVETDFEGQESETLLVENHALLMYSPFLQQ